VTAALANEMVDTSLFAMLGAAKIESTIARTLFHIPIPISKSHQILSRNSTSATEMMVCWVQKAENPPERV
jgi:hypothetical protein